MSLKGFNSFYKKYLTSVANRSLVVLIIVFVILSIINVVMIKFFFPDFIEAYRNTSAHTAETLKNQSTSQSVSKETKEARGTVREELGLGEDKPLFTLTVLLFSVLFSIGLLIFFIYYFVIRRKKEASIIDQLLKHARRVELPLKKFRCSTDQENISSKRDASKERFYLTSCRMIVEYMGRELKSPFLPKEFIDILYNPSSQEHTYSDELSDYSEYERKLELVNATHWLHEESWVVVLIDPKNPKNYFIDLEATAENYLRLALSRA